MVFIKLVAFAIVLGAIDNCLSHTSCQFSSNIGLFHYYDFIIVGAGSAGSVVANRLSEDGDVTVLLLEAGGDENEILNEIPQLFNNIRSTNQNWNYPIIFPRSGFPENKKQNPIWAQGKVLGGSSSINGMMYVRGNRRDYEDWNRDVGGEWSWEEVLKAFKKSEDSRMTNVDESYHGKGGYLTVTHVGRPDSLTKRFLEATKEIGWEMRDVNGESPTGIMHMQYTIRDGARCSTNKAFLKSASHRPNLYIVTYAFVRKVLLETLPDDSVKAIGVVFQCSNSHLTVRVRKEVILSTGTVRSPQLLLLSGVGPRQQLEKFQINTIVDLPGVGENLREHVTLINFKFVAATAQVTRECSESGEFESQLIKWAVNKTGRLTEPLAKPNLMAFIDTKASQDGWPDVQFLFTEYFGTSKLKDSKSNSQLVSFCGILPLRLQSRGQIRLGSNDPVAPPIIEPRYLSNESDVDTIIRGIHVCESLANTKALSEAGIRLQIDSYPACSKFDKSSEEYLRCTVKLGYETGLHGVGTCKMGAAEDEMAVVDNQLRVFGVDGLRVIDASVMPDVPSGNTNAPTIMVAERGADFIKRQWKLKPLVDKRWRTPTTAGDYNLG